MKPVDLASLVLLAALWGGSYMFIRVAAPAFGPAPLMFGRVVIAGVLLWAVLRGLRKPIALRGLGGRIMVIGLLNAALPFTLVAAAELHITASLASVLTATVPLFGTILAVYWLDERLTANRVVGVVTGFAGVAIVAGWSSVDFTTPAALSIAAVLVGSLSYAASGIYAKRTLAGIPSSTLALGQQAGAAAWLAIPAMLWLPSSPPSPEAVGSLLALAVLATSLAFVLYYRLIARIGPTLTQTVTYLIPLFGIAWGALFLNERITPGMLIGCGLIIGSIALVGGVRLRIPSAAKVVASR